MSTGTVDRNSWHNSYGDVYHLCVATPESQAERLYDATKQYLNEHVKNLYKEVTRRAEEVTTLERSLNHVEFSPRRVLSL